MDNILETLKDESLNDRKVFKQIRDILSSLKLFDSDNLEEHKRICMEINEVLENHGY